MQVAALLTASDNLLSSIIEDSGLKLPSVPTPCFYAPKDKGHRNHPGTTATMRLLESDHSTVEKYRDYFTPLRHHEPSEYETVFVVLRRLGDNIGILLNALNQSGGSATPAPGGQGFSGDCFNTSHYQQAVTLLSLQVFLKDTLQQHVMLLQKEA
jgi:hypothetical protein